MRKSVLLALLMIFSLLLIPTAALRAQTPVPRAIDEKPQASTWQNEEPPTECLQRMAEDFAPMTRSERFVYALNRAVGPSALLISTAKGGLNDGVHRPKEWDQGIDGFGKRWGSTYAQHFIGAVLENGVGFALHAFKRYFASSKLHVWVGLLYAGESTL